MKTELIIRYENLETGMLILEGLKDYDFLIYDEKHKTYLDSGFTKDSFKVLYGEFHDNTAKHMVQLIVELLVKYDLKKLMKEQKIDDFIGLNLEYRNIPDEYQFIEEVE